MEFENTSEIYNKILAKYIDYLSLFAIFNNGSIEDATTFEQFYWEITFHGEYRDSNQVSRLA